MGEPFLGEIKLVSFNLAPKGWAFCNGQLLSVNQNQALFALLGTTYGGNGQTTFGLPNLQGRTPLHVGQGIALGGVGGEALHTLTVAEMPTHQHSVSVDGTTAAASNASAPSNGNALGASIGQSDSGDTFSLNVYNSTLSSPAPVASQMIANNGSSQPHENRQPFQVVSAIIALQGIYPVRN